MRYYTMLVIVMIISVLICTSTPHASDRPWDNDNNYALLFKVSHNFSLETFSGSIFSLQRRTSSGAAWRLGISVRSCFEDREFWDYYGQSSRIEEHVEQNRSNISVSLQHLIFIKTGTDVDLYFGIGPRLGYANYSETLERAFERDSIKRDSIKSERFKTEWQWGLSISIGTEFFVLDNISLVGEYETSLQYRHFYYEAIVDGNVEGEATNNAFRIDALGVKFGLAAYL